MNYLKTSLLAIVIIATLVLLLARCSSVRSWFDGVQLVYQFNTSIEGAKAPEGFVVTPREIRSITPLTKFGWNIYADNEYYYLSAGIQKLFSKTGDNSCLAKKNGIRIKGTSRDDFEMLVAYKKKNELKYFSAKQLRTLMKEK